MMRKLISAGLAALFWLGAAGAALATDCSGTITTGGTAQAVSIGGGNLRGLLVANNSANLMCISWNGSAATIAGTNCGAGSWVLAPGSATTAGGLFSKPAQLELSVLSIISSTTGDRFSCERQ